MKAQVISFKCTLKNKLGQMISSSYHRQLVTPEEEIEIPVLQGLLKGLKDLKPGEKKEIFVPAEEAYGFYDQRLVFEVPRRKLPDADAIQVGDELPGQSEDGSQIVFRVVGKGLKKLTLDANHPLAGEDLIFDVEAMEVHDATEEELDLQAKPIQYVDMPNSGYIH